MQDSWKRDAGKISETILNRHTGLLKELFSLQKNCYAVEENAVFSTFIVTWPPARQYQEGSIAVEFVQER